MNNYTCKDCRHFRSIICCPRFGCKEEENFCIDFETKSGKRPRFCRLASSVDEMAEALVIEDWDFRRQEVYYRFLEYDYDAKGEAIAAAKAWLLEVEE